MEELIPNCIKSSDLTLKIKKDEDSPETSKEVDVAIMIEEMREELHRMKEEAKKYEEKFKETYGGEIMEELITNDIKTEIKKYEDSPEALKEVAENSLTSILQQVQECENRIQEAEKLNQEAENMDFGAKNTAKRIFSLGFAGNSQNDKTNLMTCSNALHMEATRELATIQQQTLSFVCLPIAFSYAINKALEDIVKNGFKDADGNIKKLTGAAAKMVEQMDIQAKENIKRHEAKEQELKQMKAQMTAMKSNNKKILFAFAVIAIILICAILIAVTVLK